MNLVAATCPNCGAALHVNYYTEKVRCEYCSSILLYEDVMIQNNEQVHAFNKYMQLGNRLYEQGQCHEALAYYSKSLEINPDEPIAMLRSTLCKALNDKILSSRISYISSAFHDVVYVLKQNGDYKEKIEFFVKNVSDTMDTLYKTINRYSSANRLGLSEAESILSKYVAITECYETILPHSKNQNQIIEKIIITLRGATSTKRYVRGTDEYGRILYSKYALNPDLKTRLGKKISYYEEMLAGRVSPDIPFEESKYLDANSLFDMLRSENKGCLSAEKRVTTLFTAICFEIASLLTGAFWAFLVFLFVLMLIIPNELSAKILGEKGMVRLQTKIVLFYTLGVILFGINIIYIWIK